MAQNMTPTPKGIKKINNFILTFTCMRKVTMPLEKWAPIKIEATVFLFRVMRLASWRFVSNTAVPAAPVRLSAGTMSHGKAGI